MEMGMPAWLWMEAQAHLKPGHGQPVSQAQLSSPGKTSSKDLQRRIVILVGGLLEKPSCVHDDDDLLKQNMNRVRKFILLLACCAAAPLMAQLEVVAPPEAQAVFSGPARPVEVIFHNTGTITTNVSVRTRIYQTSTSTAAPFGQLETWKSVRTFPGQTVLESGAFDFPEVRGKTRFLIQWIDEGTRIIGNTEVLVFPTNLLAELHNLLKGKPVGIIDSENNLKSSLKALDLDFEDLADNGVERFTGNLAIIWSPIHSANQSSELKRKVTLLAKTGKDVVWIVPMHEHGHDAEPRMLPLQAGSNTVVIVQSNLVSNFQSNPQSQLNLLRAVGMATSPELLQFSENKQ
jgi:hypothetical protein